MSLVALDGPGKKERVYDAKFIGYLGAENAGDFDFGGISMKEYMNSGRTSVQGAIATKKNPTANLEVLIDHIDSELSGAGKPNFNVDVLNDALKELQQWQLHDAATPQQAAQITDLMSKITALKGALPGTGSKMGASPLPGWPTSIPSYATGVTELSPGIYIGNSIQADGSNHYLWFFLSPMGLITTDGTRTGAAVTDNSAAAQKLAFADLFNQMFSSINAWLQINDFTGSGNVQTASSKSGEANFNLAAHTNDGWGGYLVGLNTYLNFLNLITNPNFKVTNPSTNLLQKLAADVVTASKAVTTVVKQVAKAAVTVAKTVVKDVVTIAAAPARLAALTAIRSNFENLATSLAQAWNQDSGKVSNMWSGLGGTPSDLEAAIKQGGGKISGPRRIGETALQEAAVPVINAIMAFLRTLGIPIPPALQSAVDKAVANLVGLTPAEKVAQGIIPATIPVPVVNGIPASGGILTTAASPSNSTFSFNPWILAGIGILGLGTILLISKKK